MTKLLPSFGIIAIILTLTAAGYLWFNVDILRGQFYLVWVIALSVITFLYYGYDKFQAWRSGTRVPENLLHLLALAGGWAGGWAGMFLFWHKISKSTFGTVLLLATIIHMAIYFIIIPASQ